MADIIVRAAEPHDAPACAEIFNQRPIALGTLQILYMSVKEREEWLRWSPTDRPLVAEIDGRVVATGGLHLFGGRRSHVGSFGMSVDERYWNLGVGAALMDAIVDLADNWYNLVRLQLEVWVDNHAGIHLYEKYGFVVEGRHRAYGFRDGAYVDAFSMARLRPNPPLLREVEGA
jgi:putative acetyltransferase